MSAQKSYGVVDNIEGVKKLFGKLIADNKPFSYDLETGYDGPPREKSSVRAEIAFVVGFSVTNSTEWARYIPIRHDMAVNVDPEQFALACWPLMQTGLGVAHNAKFELRFLSELFKEFVPETEDGVYPIRSDTMVESYLVQETRSHGLKQLTKEHFNHNSVELPTLFPELTASKVKSMRFNALELTPKVISYVCEDAVWCLALHERNYHKVKDSLLFKTEMELIPILAEMERFGLRYDWTMMNNAAVELESFMAKWRAEIMAELSDIVGEPVNINLGSAQQVSAILYDRIGLRTTRMTTTSKDSGEPKMSTDAIALEGLGQKYPYVRKMVQYREMTKLLGTYLQKYQKNFAYAADGRTHPNVNSTFIITGRVSVNDPPYQQTPKDYDYTLSTGEQFHFAFRKAIQAGPDHYLVGFDYSQVELRWMAGLAQEPTLLKDFDEGVDVHSRTASLMLKVPLNAVTKSQRAIGKTMNFALLYQMGVKSLAERLGVTVEEAKSLNEQYFSAFSSIAVWSDRVMRQGTRDGFTTSHFGRKHRIWELEDDQPWIRSKGERMCVNCPVQGGAADYMKIAMVRSQRALTKADLIKGVHLVMNIHDALVYEVHKSIDPALVIRTLEPAISYPVKGFPPIEAEWGVGRRWGTMVDVVLNPDGSISPKPDDDETVQTVQPVSPFVEVTADLRLPEQLENTEQCNRCGKLIPRDQVFEHAAAHNSEQAQNGSRHEQPNSLSETTLETPSDTDDNQAMITIPPGGSEPDGQELVITLEDWPTAQQLTSFKQLATQNPGTTTVTIKSPDGQAVQLNQLSSLSPTNSSQISMIFHGATTHYTSQSVDPARITEGLSL